jgi:putative membrane protein
VIAGALWTQWSIDPSFALMAILVLLWWQGGRASGSGHRLTRRSAAFWGGLLTLVVALNSPVDAESERLFWVHMVQHVLLLTVAPPLLVLGRPMPRVLRALPRGARMRAVREVRSGRLGAPLRLLARPWVSWAAFAVSLLVWHIPGLYDAALRNQAIHDLEHLSYIGSGLLFWNHALAIPPFANGLDALQRAVYVTSAMIVGWILAITLAVVPHPLYSFYANQHLRPGGISAIADQQLAAGVMWVPGSVAFTVAIVLAIYRWLEPSRATAPPRVTLS